MASVSASTSPAPNKLAQFDFFREELKEEGLDGLASDIGVLERTASERAADAAHDRKDALDPHFATPLMAGVKSPGTPTQKTKPSPLMSSIRKRRKISGAPTTPSRSPLQSTLSFPSTKNPVSNSGSSTVDPKGSPFNTSAMLNFNPPTLSGEHDRYTDFKQRMLKLPGKIKTNTGQKGLRHFSLKVCEKVESKRSTTYQEVAECLIRELANPDEKNIRRRVYDALNVLMAMGIISKHKKEISWVGLPGGVNQDIRRMAREKTQRMYRIKRKHEELSNLLQEMVCYKNLVTRNGRREKEGLNSSPTLDLPYVLVRTDRNSIIQLEMNDDRKQVFFNFSMPFQIEEDKEIMKKMGLTRVAPWDIPRIVPRELVPFYPKEMIEEPVKIEGVSNRL